jgi:hypothetical protein
VATSSAAGLALIVGVIGVFVGRNFRTARGANADLKVHKGRIPGFRRTRNRNGLWSIVLVVAHPARADRVGPRLAPPPAGGRRLDS